MSKKNTIFRPTLDDVERLSRGQGAKVRGTGSRAVCHRLNKDEKRLFEHAKQFGYLVTRLDGYRKARRGSPVLNTYRQYCDAKGRACIRIEKNDHYDLVVVDLSPLRVRNFQPYLNFLHLFMKKKEGLEDLSTSQNQQLNDEDLMFPIWALPERKISFRIGKNQSRSLVSEIFELTEAFHEREIRTQNKQRA